MNKYTVIGECLCGCDGGGYTWQVTAKSPTDALNEAKKEKARADDLVSTDDVSVKFHAVFEGHHLNLLWDTEP